MPHLSRRAASEPVIHLSNPKRPPSWIRQRHTSHGLGGYPAQPVSSTDPGNDAALRQGSSALTADFKAKGQAANEIFGQSSTSQRTFEALPGKEYQRVQASYLSEGPPSTRSSGRFKITTQDAKSNVQTIWEADVTQNHGGSSVPHERQFLAKTIHNQTMNQGQEVRFPDYGRSTQPFEDFVPGRVIEVLLVPPSSGTYTNVTQLTQFTPDPRFSGVGTGTRRFVVVSPCSAGSKPTFRALPIRTYYGLGVAAPKVVKSHHAIIYSQSQTRSAPPAPQPNERPQRLPDLSIESPMRQVPIEIQKCHPTWQLDPMSRLDLFDVHTLDAYIGSVKLYGRLTDRGLHALRAQYRAVWDSKQRPQSSQETSAASTNQGSNSLATIRKVVMDLHEYARSQNLHPPQPLDEAKLLFLTQNNSHFNAWLRDAGTAFAAQKASRELPNQSQVAKSSSSRTTKRGTADDISGNPYGEGPQSSTGS